VEPQRFVDLLLEQHPANQRTIMRTFRERYSSGELQRELAPERPWLGEVKNALMAAAAAAAARSSPMGKFRIEKLIEWDIAPALGTE
jgi:hypothetical protein